MGIVELILIAIGLAMDAFAVSICKGLAMGKTKISNALIVGLWFGGFQALMPMIGYLLGAQFERYISSIDHWIAFVLLVAIGFNMIRESVSKKEENYETASIGVKVMFVLAVATSIDALAVGVTFAFLRVNILLSVAVIGCITFVLSVIGIKVGSVVGRRFKSKAEFAGGVILILIGLKILLEHMNVF
jgi:putative Mn2+ efflux pump MntP